MGNNNDGMNLLNFQADYYTIINLEIDEQGTYYVLRISPRKMTQFDIDWIGAIMDFNPGFYKFSYIQ